MLKSQDGSVAGQYRLQSLLYGFFEILSRDVVVKEGTQSMENFYIERAIKFIKNYYSEGIKVTDIAEHLCVNRSYLYKLFKSSLQMSPQELLTRFRISRSKELLKVTKLSIENIALSCGYQDSLVFSKAFKKNVGCVPTVYRREHEKILGRNIEENKELLEELRETF